MHRRTLFASTLLVLICLHTGPTDATPELALLAKQLFPATPPHPLKATDYVRAVGTIGSPAGLQSLLLHSTGSLTLHVLQNTSCTTGLRRAGFGVLAIPVLGCECLSEAFSWFCWGRQLTNGYPIIVQ